MLKGNVSADDVKPEAITETTHIGYTGYWFSRLVQSVF